MMAPSLEQTLGELGKRLAQAPLSKDTLLKLLKQTVSSLSELNQSPTLRSVLGPINEALVQPAVLRHKDKDARLLVAACFSEIMRILAPDPPYSDDLLKDIFKLFVSIFEELDEVESPYFSRRVNILETIAKVRCCVLMLDINCEDVVLEMFRVFFSVVREDHPPSVQQGMTAIMELILEESGDISQRMLDLILGNLLKDHRNASLAAHQLSISVVQHCTEKLEPVVQQFLTSVMLEGKAAGSDLQENYHNIIFEIYQCAPHMLLAVIPNLTQELLTDQVDVRLKAVHLLGKLFALHGRHVAQEYHQLFAEFLKRFSDKTVEVRLAAVECAKDCFLANPSGNEASEILSGLQGRLLDFDDKVRIQVVNVICDIAKINPRYVSSEIIKNVAERLRDKKVSVRKDTLQKLVEVYRAYCMKCLEGFITCSEEFEWIPSKIIRICFDKDCKEFRPAGMELIFAEDLFPVQLPVDERTHHWIAMFSVFCPSDIRALEHILSQKQRLQQEMQVYLSLRQSLKEDDSMELNKKIQMGLKTMSLCFIDPVRAEENFQKLHQMKDNNVFKGLSQLLDPNTTVASAQAIREDLLKRIGERHPQYEFLKTLYLKCSYILFGMEHVQAVLSHSYGYKTASNQNLKIAGIDLLLKILSFFPFLIKGSEEDLLRLLSEDDESLKERIMQIIAKAGTFIHNQQSIGAILEKLCTEGKRKQAKYAISAISALSAESGQEILLQLYEKLVSSLEDCQNLPTTLQSLGCIAQTAISIFETREEEIIKFIVRKLLRRECESLSEESQRFKNAKNELPSNVCQLKIYGLKALVKSFLPYKDGHLRQRFKGLLRVLEKLLQTGDISDNSKSSESDKAYLRLTAAKSVLRLARRWDFHIWPQIFHLTVLRAQDSSVHVRQQFLNKVQKCLKDHTIGNKYACAFALAASDAVKDIQADAKKYLEEFIDNYHREARLRQTSRSVQGEGAALVVYPEYVLVYLVHALGHHPKFPSGSDAENAEAYEPFIRQLLLFLQVLICQDRSNSGRKDETDNMLAILSIFRAIRRAEDAVDKSFTQNLHVLCDIGIIIAKDLGRDKISSGRIPGGIPMPSLFYKVSEENKDEKTDGSYLPPCLTKGKALAWFLDERNTLHSSQKSSSYGKRTKRNQAEFLSEEIDHDSGEESIQNQSMTNNTLANRMEDPEKGNSLLDYKKKSVSCKQGQNLKSKSQVTSDAPKDSRKRRKPQKVQSVSANERDLTVHGTEFMPAKLKKHRSEMEAENKDFGERDSPTNTTMEGKNQNSDSDDLPVVANISQVVQQETETANIEHSIQDEILKVPGMSHLSRKTLLGGSLRCQSSRKEQGSEECNTAVEDPRQKKDSKIAHDAVARGLETPVANYTESPEWKSDKDREGDEELVGQRIRVWWPVDRRFNSGTLNEFDPANKTHKIEYDDGEVELLHLGNERWEVITNRQKDALKFPAKGRKGKQRKLCFMTPALSNIDVASCELNEMGIDSSVDLVKAAGAGKPELPSAGEEQKSLKNTGSQISMLQQSKNGKNGKGKKPSVKEKGTESHLEARENDGEALAPRRARRQKVVQ
ncbi:hypothetical protein SUGI_0830400 [Cryptomeria japonica]|uniref:sister chromatid cohesion protein PDS5 homolog A isoform X2 n=1 Tax=Cryptomeria japonica TaxID=3369 RepID=UPI0024146FCC|nr:sister chromatid cohesion protein PDS5 homolog A isoform X2 [Cryptomeria japonica]GLJ40362.1 hypothetical protein SUGI_0830400 [Cryptomeria japonica]